MTLNTIFRASLIGWLVAGMLVAVPAVFAGEVLIDNFEEDAFDNGPVNSNSNFFNPSSGSGSIANSRFVTLAISGGPSDSSAMKLDLSGGNDGVQVNFLDETGGTSSGSFSTLQYNGFSVDLTGGGSEKGLAIKVSETSASPDAPMHIRSDVHFGHARLDQNITGPGTYRYPFADYSEQGGGPGFPNPVAQMNFLIFAHNSGPGGGFANITISDIRTYVPEPATGLLALGGLLALPWRRRR